MSFAIARAKSGDVVEFYSQNEWWANPSQISRDDISHNRSEAVILASSLGIKGNLYFLDLASEVRRFENTGVWIKIQNNPCKRNFALEARS